MAESWLPDWQNPAEYSPSYFVRPEETFRFYSWQFLRRNSEYQKAYLELRKIVVEADLNLKNRKPGVRSEFVVGNYGYAQQKGIYNHPRDLGNKDPDIENYINAICTQFFMGGFIPDPAWRDWMMPPMITGTNLLRPGWFSKLDTTKFKHYDWLIEIDLRYSLCKQLTAARKELDIIQTEVFYPFKLIPTPKSSKNEILIIYPADEESPLQWKIVQAENFHPFKLISAPKISKNEILIIYMADEESPLYWKIVQAEDFHKYKPISANKSRKNEIIIRCLADEEPPLDWGSTTGKPHLRLAPIEMHFALAPQIARHHERLKQEQTQLIGEVLRPTANNYDPESLVRYLRILDAKKTTSKTIAKVLYPGMPRYVGDGVKNHSPAYKRLYDEKETAIRLRDTDWITLLT